MIMEKALSKNRYVALISAIFKKNVDLYNQNEFILHHNLMYIYLCIYWFLYIYIIFVFCFVTFCSIALPPVPELWIQLHGLERIEINVHGLEWIEINVHGLAWIEINVHGLAWIEINVHGLAWIEINVQFISYAVCQQTLKKLYNLIDGEKD